MEPVERRPHDDDAEAAEKLGGDAGGEQDVDDDIPHQSRPRKRAKTRPLIQVTAAQTIATAM